MTKKKRKRRPMSWPKARRLCMDRVLVALDDYYIRDDATLEETLAIVAGALTAKFGQTYVVKKVTP